MQFKRVRISINWSDEKSLLINWLHESWEVRIIESKSNIWLTFGYQWNLGIGYPSLKSSCELVISQEIRSLSMKCTLT